MINKIIAFGDSVTFGSESPELELGDLSQHMQNISDVNRFNEIIAGTFGPQMINVIVNQNETAKYLAEKMNLPEKLIRDEQEQQQIVQQISQLQSSAGEGEVPQ